MRKTGGENAHKVSSNWNKKKCEDEKEKSMQKIDKNKAKERERAENGYGENKEDICNSAYRSPVKRQTSSRCSSAHDTCHRASRNRHWNEEHMRDEEGEAVKRKQTASAELSSATSGSLSRSLARIDSVRLICVTHTWWLGLRHHQCICWLWQSGSRVDSSSSSHISIVKLRERDKDNRQTARKMYRIKIEQKIAISDWKMRRRNDYRFEIGYRTLKIEINSISKWCKQRLPIEWHNFHRENTHTVSTNVIVKQQQKW